MNSTLSHKLLTASLTAAACFTTGCHVGPKYIAPAVPPPPAFKESAPPAYSGALPGTWAPANPQDAAIKGKWWEIFHEPELNALEEQLDINNQNIVESFQNFMAARATVGEYRAQLFPTATLAPSYSRQSSPSTLKNSSSNGTTGTGTGTGTTTTTTTTRGTTSTNISLPVDISWAPDLWGKIASQIREYQNAAQISAADLENERLTEQAALAEYYFDLRGQDALQDLDNRTVDADQKIVDLTKALYDNGIDNEASVVEAEATLQQAQVTAAGAATNRAIYEHAIAVLIGKPPSDVSLRVKNLSTPVPAIPVGVPSELLERRPDIAAAERTLAEQNALTDYEIAAFYPSLTLTGGGGVESSLISSLFSSPALFWSTAASASQLLYDGGARKAALAQYTAQYNADLAAYKQTVLTAFQQVEDYIATLRTTSQEILLEDTAVKSAQRSFDLETARYQNGIDPYIDVLNTQTTLLADQTNQINLRISEMTAAVELVQALGGGWNVSQLPTAKAITKPAAVTQVSSTP
jgi:NodT family efflux transporter outer membrane factor (OMF) lipoprotein